MQMSPDFVQINAGLGGPVAHTRATNYIALQLGFLSLFKNSFSPCPEVLLFYFLNICTPPGTTTELICLEMC